MYTKTIKVSDEVYSKLMELCRAHNITPNKLLKQLLEGVTPNSPSREERGNPISEKYISPSRESGDSPCRETRHSPYQEGEGNPIAFLRNRVTPSRDCVARRVGKVYFVECADGSRAFIPEAVLPELVERFGMVVVE